MARVAGTEMDDRLAQIRRDVVGADASFDGPFGRKAMLYADWTASGRALVSVEDYVRDEVLPLYANTHTTTSTCGLQSTCFRQEARQLIAQACNARVGYSDKHADVVVFAGSGSTAAINKLCLVLGMHLPPAPGAPREAQPVVLVGPHEHHSNLLPWRESSALVVQIPEDPETGSICLKALRRALTKYRAHGLVAGSFSAASNVTGAMADVDAVTETLHRHGALAFWDYAAAAPYVPIDMNPVRFQEDGSVNPHVYKDAVFVSPHKLPGGPGAPGVLVAKRALFANEVPSEPGGGTVFFVTEKDQRYLSARHEREEGGTQDIVGSVRAGLAFQTKARVGAATIARAERSLRETVYASLTANANVAVLGLGSEGYYGTFPEKTHTRRLDKGLPIVSFLIRAPADSFGKSRFLHHSFVCAVLNDVFGVQARGGCACAGPYALSLLGLDPAGAAALETLLLDQSEVMRPGFSRLSLPYFASPAEIAYALAAVHAVANHGWRLLTLYRLDAKTGEWRHTSRARSFPERKWLAHMRAWGEPPASGDAFEKASREPLDAAREAAREATLKTQLAEGLALLERCGQTAGADKGTRGHLRVPAIDALEMSSEREMLTSGTRDEEEPESARLSYDESSSAEAKAIATGSVAKSISRITKKKAVVVDAETADALRWFVFPSEGAALLRKALPLSIPREVPGAGSYLPLSVVPEHGRVAGVIRPAGYDDARGAANASADAWPRGLERIAKTLASTRDGSADGDAGGVSCDVSFRAVSSKYPLRVTAASGGVNALGGLAAARRGEPAPAPIAPVADEQKRENTFFPDDETMTVHEPTVDVTVAQTSNDLDQRPHSPPRDAPETPASPPDPETTNNAASANSSASLAGAKGFASPPAKLMRSVSKAVSEWQMIVPGDRVMLGLSGGKDSLAMLHVLKALQRRYPPGTFELACCTIDPGTEAFNPRPLIQYCASLGVEYHYMEERIMDMASEHMSGDSICAFCARMKRGALYSCMREHGYNKLVLAQHLDDVVESFLMSTMHNGLIRTMKAAYVVDEGDLTVIRPGIYCRERQLRDFSYAAGLPVINENCPACFEAPKERHHIKKLLAREEGVFPSLYPCLRRALTPLLDPAATDLLAAIRRAVERQSKVGRQALAQKRAAAREKKAGVPSRAGGVPDEPLQDRARVDGGGDDTDETKERSRATTATALRDCTETELLAELVARRARGRLGKEDPSVLKRAELGDGAITPPRPRTPSTDLGDAEMRADIAELNAFCTADGCTRFPAEDDDE